MSPVIPLYLSYYAMLVLGTVGAIAGHSGKDLIPGIVSSEHERGLIWVGWLLLVLSLPTCWGAVANPDSPFGLRLLTMAILCIHLVGSIPMILYISGALKKELQAQAA